MNRWVVFKAIKNEYPLHVRLSDIGQVLCAVPPESKIEWSVNTVDHQDDYFRDAPLIVCETKPIAEGIARQVSVLCPGVNVYVAEIQSASLAKPGTPVMMNVTEKGTLPR